MKSVKLISAVSLILASSIFSLSGCNAPLDSKSDNGEGNISSAVMDTASESNSASDFYTAAASQSGTADLYYVTGTSAPIGMRESADDKSTVTAQLENGDEVHLVSADSGVYYYVYSVKNDKYGYVKQNYLVNDSYAVCEPETYFASDSTALYSSNDSSAKELQNLSKNAQLTVIAKLPGDYWYVNIPDSTTFGYVKTEKIASKKSESSSKSSSLQSAATANNTTNNSGYYIGSGSAPTSYSKYYAKVNSGYLAVRSAQNASDSNIIGKLYTGDTVYVISYPGTYWYCYAPSLGIYGFINGSYLSTSKPNSTTTYSYDSSTKWTVKGTNNYLALRSAPSYNSSNEIGKLYNGDYVYVSYYDSYYDTYWYVYSPTLGMYGYVNSNYIYS